ncbi:LLM class flavin-dependent oxidoreductase [Microbispora sp. NBRC 16548]|uniref:LLM class flavin-dependent oxidoreductase n=1 Tax=Microbispora sp. NBRC 16548 TaxID=3030994 RepID=UPI0024A0775D|nr:LLM class flavin-dependent oxidoreductase [Microbispora sp. NBRC 16548]GLX11121.1 hypothetical protein Misp03_80470 [Microbispora sp. NBRC 16548]
MRLGAEIDLSVVPLADVASRAAQAEEAGLALVWLTPAAGRPQEALVAAAACAATTRYLHVGVHAVSGARHPLYLAEELHVLDQLLGGRLVTAVVDEADDQDRLAETLSVLLSAQATRPFRHTGHHWTIPAGLAENPINPEHRLRVTPAPFRLHAELWLHGLAGTACAARFGLPLIAAVEDTAPDVSTAWERVTASLGDAAMRMRRAAFRPLAGDGVADAASLVSALRAERDLWGMDTVIVRLPGATDTGDWGRALQTLAGYAGPRLQLDRLPSGLEEFWDERLAEFTRPDR